MSNTLKQKLVGVAAATTAGLLMLGAPAQAAPTSPAAIEQATIAANNAAVIESLPPNVTMKVIGKLPELKGPTYNYIQDGPTTTAGGVTTFALKTLPYSFTFTDVYDKTGDTSFKPTKTSVCTDIQARYSQQGQFKDFRVSLEGGDVKVPLDNVARSFCFSGLTINKEMRFRYYFADACAGGCSFSRASGNGQVRYP